MGIEATTKIVEADDIGSERGQRHSAERGGNKR